jgi:hypothetical protein
VLSAADATRSNGVAGAPEPLDVVEVLDELDDVVSVEVVGDVEGVVSVDVVDVAVVAGVVEVVEVDSELVDVVVVVVEFVESELELVVVEDAVVDELDVAVLPATYADTEHVAQVAPVDHVWGSDVSVESLEVALEHEAES